MVARNRGDLHQRYPPTAMQAGFNRQPQGQEFAITFTGIPTWNATIPSSLTPGKTPETGSPSISS
jgi:hypothetical protein